MPFSQSRAYRWLLGLLIVGGVAAGAGAMAFHQLFLRDLPDLRRIEYYRPPTTSIVLDRHGELIGEFYNQRRRLVQVEQVPQHVKQAFVSAEDKSFYEHSGIDYRSIMRAVLVNLRAGGEKRQGASTITQQMVKGLFLSPEKTYRRKIREMILARKIEQHFTKDEILYLYVNQIYFGHGAWGIGQAARSYFGKEAEALTISEAALLAGLPQRPSEWSPYKDPESAERRRRYVLGRMLEDGYIESDQYEYALDNPPEIHEHEELENLAPAAHFTELVRRYLFDRLGGDRVLDEGLVIETTLDLALQKSAVAAVREGLVEHDRRRGYRGPLARVPADRLDAELERLAEANAELLAVPEEEEEAEPGADRGEAIAPEGEDALAAALAEAERVVEESGEPTTDDVAEAPPSPVPFGEPLEGVVLEVDRKAKTALIGFAPDILGEARLEDVDWAKEVDPKVRPRPVKRIERIFAVGDVARFVRLPDLEPEQHDDEETLVAAPLPRLDIHQEPIVQGALLSIDNASGDVMSLVGGYDYHRSEFNRAVQALRQPGSAFKPFIYGAALEKGFHPVSEVIDRPVVYTDPVSGFVWAPRNYGRKFYGSMPMRNALKKSVNNATVHLFRDVGVDFVIDYARRFGIQSELSRDLSLALGSSSVTLLELTTAYAVYPNKGKRVVPRFINRVVDRSGRELLKDVPLGDPPPPVLKPLTATEGEALASYPDAEILPTDEVISEAAAFLMCDLLKAVIQEGTGRRVARLDRRHELGGKTGTTNEQGDAWFMGFSPDITTGVWVGHDDNRVLGWGETGAGAALPIWGDYMKVALADLPPSKFDEPPGIVKIKVDRETGLLADDAIADAYMQPFIIGQEPERSVSQHESAQDARQALREDDF